MAARRILILVAVLLGVTALTSSLAPPESRKTTTERTPPTPSSPSPNAAATDDDVQVVSAEETDQEIEAEVGRRLRIEVTSASLGSVQLGDYGPIESVQPASPARFDVLYDRAGEHTLSLLSPRTPIARVSVTAPNPEQ